MIVVSVFIVEVDTVSRVVLSYLINRVIINVTSIISINSIVSVVILW